MKKNHNESNGIVHYPNLIEKLHIGVRHFFAVYSRGAFYKLICGLVLILTTIGLPMLTWILFDNIFGIEIVDFLIFAIFVFGFFLGLFFAFLLSYHFYISGWHD